MREVSQDVTLNFLNGSPLHYRDEIYHVSGNPMFFQSRIIYADATDPSVIMSVIESGREAPYFISVSFSGYEETFVAECVRWLQEHYNYIDTLKSLDERVLETMQKAFCLKVLPSLKTFVCESIDSVPKVTVNVVKLTEADKDAVDKYYEEPLSYSAGIGEYFSNCVLEGDGEIIAVKDGNEILAYLAYTLPSRGTCEMYMIHVRQDQRGKGLGVQLASFYARSQFEAGVIPFYDGAQTKESEKTAIKAGFTLCRQDYRADELRRKDI